MSTNRSYRNEQVLVIEDDPGVGEVVRMLLESMRYRVELVNRGDAGLDAPDVGLAQHELVEGDVPRWGQDDVLGCFRHQIFSTTGAGSHSPDLTSRHPSNPQPFPLVGYRPIAA